MDNNMPKIKFSDFLGAQLKEFRMQYKKKAVDVAKYMDKSPAYISKLEKGQIQQIEKKELVKMANFITGVEDGYIIFCEKIAQNIDADELEKEIWYLNFDLMERQLPITEAVIKLIKENMANLNVSPTELANYINENEDLGKDFFAEHDINPETVDKNVWLPYREADSAEVRRSFIYINYDEKRIEDFIEGKIDKCEYMFPYVMLYHLLKIYYKLNGDVHNDKMIDTCKQETEEILLSNKFYSISVQYSMRKKMETEEEYQNALSKFDLENKGLISRFLNEINFLSNYDVKYTNERLEKIVDNFDGDPSFALGFMSLPLFKLKDLSSTRKREFLKEINENIKRYCEMTQEVDIEKY